MAWQSVANFGKSLSREGVIAAGTPLEVAVTVKDEHANFWPGKGSFQSVFYKWPQKLLNEQTMHSRWIVEVAGKEIRLRSSGWPGD